jgi:ATP-dependent helicase Lhr and Lhr-like helicase
MTKINLAKQANKSEIVKTLHPYVKEWFFSKFQEFSLPQRYGVLNIHNKKDILISAPTGGTKTLTAFLAILNKLVILADKNQLENKTYAVYISPLKALSNDIAKNLIEPLEEIKSIASLHGKKLQDIRVNLRTGDTSKAEKAKMTKYAPHILITTPESLAIVLTSKRLVEHMEQTEYCIIDEIHSLGNKRGVYLSLSLERLNEMSKTWPVKIGLSATVEPLEEVAKFLVGISPKRSVEIAKVPFNKEIDIQVLTPVENLITTTNPYIPLNTKLHELISEHKTTLIFTNTRAATERIVHNLKEKFPKDYTPKNIAAHHSSLSKNQRFEVEENLRNGKLKVVVCSTSLELGIDIGYVDLVILLGSPKASSRALQRIGRAGHKLKGIAKGRFLVLDRDDLLECSVIQKEMVEGKIDKIQFPKNALDVLAQQIYGMAINKIWKYDELLKTIRHSYCYSDLSKSDFLNVISYLTGEYDLEKSKVYAKIWYDLDTKEIGKKGKLARVIYMTNIGTIPEESFITVKLSTGDEVGMIDESFMNRMKKGDVFVLGGNKYQYRYTRGMNLYVAPTPERSPTVPSWFSEMLPLSFESALEINEFRKLMREKLEKKKNKNLILDFIKKYLYVDNKVAEEIYNYFKQQHDFSEIPHTKVITIEKYTDERDSKKYLLVNSMYGRRVNDALSRALAYLMGIKGNRDIEIGISDRGFYFSGSKMDIEKAIEKLESKDLEKILKEAIEKTDILARRFRHCATRSLMILRTYKGQRKSVRKQQMKSHFLIAAVKKISNEFPILNEAKREVLEDLMDIENARKVLDWIKKGEVKVSYDVVRIPSPFALGLLLQGHMDLMKIEDKQEFLQRMHQVYMNEIEKKLNGTDQIDYQEFLERDN